MAASTETVLIPKEIVGHADVIVYVNDTRYVIPRGEETEVPESVYGVLTMCGIVTEEDD